MQEQIISHDDGGSVFGFDASYSVAHGTAYGFDTWSNITTIGMYHTPTTYSVIRTFLKFNTSIMPSDATIDQVNLKLTCINDYSTTLDFDVQIIKCDWSGYCPITGDNLQEIYDLGLSEDEDSSIWRNTSGMSENIPYTSGSLSTAWINKDGYTYYALRSNRDFDEDIPAISTSERISIATSENSTIEYRPTLIISYTKSNKQKRQVIIMGG